MKMRSIASLIIVSSLALAGCRKPSATEDNEIAPQATAVAKPKLTAEAVEEAYIWGLPILAMYRFTVPMAMKVGGLNQPFHNRELFEPGVLPGGANRDTLYSYGWFDLADEPIVVSLPNFGDRYFVWQMTDTYAYNFANVGSHLLEGPVETYRSGYTFMMAAPDWRGEVPKGVEVVRSTVRMPNVLYRIAVTGPDDVSAANALQDETLVLPLSEWNAGKRVSIRQQPSNPPPAYREVLTYGRTATAKEQRNVEFFSVLADALRINRPYAEWDKEMAEGPLAQIGITVGESFDTSGWNEATPSSSWTRRSVGSSA